jgi:hypothetical protein
MKEANAVLVIGKRVRVEAGVVAEAEAEVVVVATIGTVEALMNMAEIVTEVGRMIMTMAGVVLRLVVIDLRGEVVVVVGVAMARTLDALPRTMDRHLPNHPLVVMGDRQYPAQVLMYKEPRNLLRCVFRLAA